MNLSDLDPMLKGPGLSAIIAVAILLPTLKPWRSPKSPTDKPLGTWGAPSALTLSFCAVFAWLVSTPHWPPPTQWGWLFFIVLISGVAILLVTLVPKFRLLHLFAGPLAAGVLAWLLRPYVDEAQLWSWRLGVGVALILFWIIMEPLAHRTRGWPIPLALTLTAGTSAYVILLSGHATFALLTGTTVSVLGVFTLFSFRNRNASLARGGILILGVILLSMLTLTQTYFDEEGLPFACFILPLAAPAFLWIGEFPPLKRRPFLAEGVRLTACIIPLVIAILLARAGVPDVGLYDF